MCMSGLQRHLLWARVLALAVHLGFEIPKYSEDKNSLQHPIQDENFFKNQSYHWLLLQCNLNTSIGIIQRHPN